MQRFWLAIGMAAALGGLAAGVWFYWHPLPLGVWMTVSRIGSAPTFSLAKRELREIDSRGPQREDRLRELVAGWGTGNPQFDLYLAQFLGEPECSDELREAFSLELGWRPDLLPRWGRYWAWHSPQDPAEEIESIIEYLAALASVEPPRRLSWRETLNLQGAIAVTGDAELARRLMPDGWRGRFQAWVVSRPDWRRIVRPDSPLPDWQEPGARSSSQAEVSRKSAPAPEPRRRRSSLHHRARWGIADAQPPGARSG